LSPDVADRADASGRSEDTWARLENAVADDGSPLSSELMAVEAADDDAVPAPAPAPSPEPDPFLPAASAEVCVWDAEIDLGQPRETGEKVREKWISC